MHVCVCTHAACVCVLLSCILNLRIQYKIDDSSLSAKPYFFEVWMVSHLLTEHKSKGNYKIIIPHRHQNRMFQREGSSK